MYKMLTINYLRKHLFLEIKISETQRKSTKTHQRQAFWLVFIFLIFFYPLSKNHLQRFTFALK